MVFDPASLCDRRFKANGACTTDGCDIFVLQEERDGFLKMFIIRPLRTMMSLSKLQ